MMASSTSDGRSCLCLQRRGEPYVGVVRLHAICAVHRHALRLEGGTPRRHAALPHRLRDGRQAQRRVERAGAPAVVPDGHVRGRAALREVRGRLSKRGRETGLDELLQGRGDAHGQVHRADPEGD